MKQGDTGERVALLQQRLNIKADGVWGPKTTVAVAEWQKQNGLTADGIFGPLSWSKILNIPIKKSKRTITEIIIHCTATKEGVPFTVSQITESHKKRGFNTIGYHYVIYQDGTIHAGRDINIAGAHCTNHNAHSLGIVYVGGLDKNGKPKDTRTYEQQLYLRLLLAALRDLYPSARFIGHRDTSPDLNKNGKVDKWEWIKDCPCFDVRANYQF